MLGLIVAISPEGVIGKAGTIPWHYPGDLRRFRRMTLGSTVIMGRRTWESLGGRPLGGRRNIVLSHRALDLPPGAELAASLDEALARAQGDCWVIGGASVYAEAMPKCDVLDVTYVPDRVSPEDAIVFPPIDLALFEAGPLQTHEDEPTLKRRQYTRRR